MANFRDSIRAISPAWLLRDIGEKFMYTFGLALDGLAASLNYGLKGRAPGNGVETADRIVGDDRKLVRYPAETDAQYEARLRGAFVAWKGQIDPPRPGAGAAMALIRQLEGFAHPERLRIRIVARSGLWHTFPESTDLPGTITKYVASPANWFWDSHSARWWRYWVIIYPNGKWTSSRKWGDGKRWGDDGWGLDIPGEQADAIRSLVRLWNRAGAHCLWIVYALDNSLFDPGTAYPDATLPDPTWENWSKLVSGVRRPSRSSAARYQSGVF